MLLKRRAAHRLVRTRSNRSSLFQLCVLLLLGCASGSRHDVCSFQTTPPANVLLPNSQTVHEISGGEVLSLGVAAVNGQTLRISIEKGDLLLSVAVYDPAGVKVIDEASHTFSDLDVGLITKSAGTYKVDVTSREQSPQRRTFRLFLAPLKVAGEDDAADLETLGRLLAAEDLMSNWSETSFRDAIAEFDKVHAIRIGERKLRDAARASMRSADALAALGKYRQAIQRYENAAREAERAGDQQTASTSLSEVGWLYSQLGENDRARRDLERELARYPVNNGPQDTPEFKRGHARVISNLGEVQYSRGDLVKAQATFNDALKRFTEMGDRAGEAHTRLFLGYIYGAFGEVQKAADQFSQSLALFQAVSHRLGEARALTAIGLTLSLKHEDEKAIQLHSDAMAIFRAIGDPQNVAITFNARGQAYEHMGEYQLALDQYAEALKLGEKTDSVDFVGSALYQIASVHQLLGDHKVARSYYERCLAVSSAAKKIRTQANALAQLASLYGADGEPGKALKEFQKVISFYNSIGERRGEAIALNNMGDLLLSLGRRAKAVTAYKQALVQSEEGQEKGLQISTLYNLARALRAGGQLDEALKYVEQSVQLVEEVRGNVASPDFRSSFFAAVRRNYSLNIALLMQLEQERPGKGYSEKALLVSEQARARSLVDILTEVTEKLSRHIDPALLERKQELEAMLRYQAQYQLNQSAAGNNETDARDSAAQLDSLRAEYEQINAQSQARNVVRVSLTQMRTIQDIQSELSSDTALLEYALGEEKSYLWVVTTNSVASYELPAQTPLETAALEVYQLLTARQHEGEGSQSSDQRSVEESDRLYLMKAANLSAFVLGPAMDRLQKKRLLVVSEGVLQYIPLEALPVLSQDRNFTSGGELTADNSEPLIASHEIISLPSISTLAAIRRERPRLSSPDKIVAVLADPVFTSDDVRVSKNQNQKPNPNVAASFAASTQPAFRDYQGLRNRSGTLRLPNTADEAEAILRIAPKGSALVALNFNANRETATSAELGQYHIIHLATHGFINSEHPELSGIVLSMVNPDGSETDGFLQLHDIYGLNLSADLVVLSACDTALGKDIKGEGLVGLTRGFMYAGARSVVASLWKVDDRATAELMEHFYKAMLQDGLSPSAALRSAKLAMRQQKRWQAPYFWAGLTLQGEYNQRINVKRSSSYLIPLCILLGLAVIGPLVLVVRRRRSSPR